MKEMGVPKGWKKVKLGDLLEEYCAKNNNQKYKAVAVGKYGIRKREDIYSKDLSKDISKNKIIMKDTLTIGMGSTQIDIGILTDDDIFCVSPAYTTYKIKNCNSKFLEYYLEYLNPKLSDLFMIVSARQGKSVDKEGLLNYEIILPPIEEQDKIVKLLKKMDSIINKYEKLLKEKERFIKSQFVEMFGDLNVNSKNYKIVKLSEISEYWNGLTYSPSDIDDKGTIVLRSSNIQNSKLDFEDIVKVNCKIREKNYVKDNDILMCSRNGSANLVGKVAMIKDINEPLCFGAFMMIIRSKYYKYLFNYFKDKNFRKNINLETTTQINQITVKMLDKIRIPLPNNSEIENYNGIVQLIDKQKLLLEQQKQNYINLKKGLMQKLLTGKVRVKI